MKKKISIIVGGSKGHGYEIIRELKKRGDYIINISRTINKNASENINVNLNKSSCLKILKKKIKSRKINSIVFSQKYRGNDFNEEIQVMVKASIDIIEAISEARGITEDELDVIGEILSNLYGAEEVRQAILSGTRRTQALNEFMNKVTKIKQ